MAKVMDNRRKVFDESLKGSDRDAAIVAACLIDNLLEKTLKSYFIENSGVNRLFENEHILQTYYAKVNITHFSGLIPSFLYHDLLLIGRIRNKFAHRLDSKISFMDAEISKLVKDFKLKPKSADDDIKNTRLKYIATITAVSGLLTFIQFMIVIHKHQGKLILLRDIIKLDESPFEEISLTESEIQKIISNVRIKKRNKSK
jgi:hypothetical protein